MTKLPDVSVHHPHVEVREGLLCGSPVVRGTKIAVRRIWHWHSRGVSVETLVKRYPSLGWAKVMDALSFAHDNLELVKADLDRERMMTGVTLTVPGQMDQLRLQNT